MPVASKSDRGDFFTTPFEVRFVWLHISQKRTKDWEGKDLAPDDQDYQATLLIPKTGDANTCKNYQMLMGKMWEVASKVWGGWPPAGAHWPILDCDAKPAELEKSPFLAGHWRIRTSAIIQPQVFDFGNNPMPKDLGGNFTGLKSGDYGFASINVWAYSKGSAGFGFGIEGIKVTRTGDPIGSGQRSVEAMFGKPTGAPSYAMPGPAAPPIPAGYGHAGPVPGGLYQDARVNPAELAQRYETPAPAPQYQQPTAAPGAYPPAPVSGIPQHPGMGPQGGPAAPQPPGQPIAPPAYGVPQMPQFGQR